MFRKIFYNTGINFVAKIIATALGLAAVVLMTHYLGGLGFGQYTIIIAYLQFFGLIADMGLTLVSAQLLAKYEDNEEKVIANLFSFRLVTAGILLGLAPLIVMFMPYAWPVKLGVFIATISFLFIALNQVLIGFYQKRLLMAKASIAEIGGRIVLVAFVLIAVLLQWGLQGIVIATTLASITQFFINYVLSLPYVKIRFAVDTKIWRDIVYLCWPIAITITFNIIYLKADTLILSLLQSETVVGLYGAAYRVIDILVTMPFILAGLALPQLTSALKNKNDVEFKNIIQHSFDVMVIIALPLAVGTQFVAAPLMRLVAGPEFFASGIILQLLIFAAAAIYLGVIFAHVIIALEKQKQTIWAYVLVAVTALTGYLIFIPRYSYFGAAAVTIYSEIAIALLIFGITYYYIHFVPNLAVSCKAIAACAVMGLGLYFFDLAVVPAIITAGIVYSATLFALAKNDFKKMVRN
jgi:O-antigen/teichoic acid export membrane protein